MNMNIFRFGRSRSESTSTVDNLLFGGNNNNNTSHMSLVNAGSDVTSPLTSSTITPATPLSSATSSDALDELGSSTSFDIQSTLPYLHHEYLGFDVPHLDQNLNDSNSSLSEEDRIIAQLNQEWDHKWREKHAEAKKVWRDFFMNNGGVTKPLDPHNKALQSLIRKFEVPSVLRRKVWMECMRVDKLVLENEGYYEKILDVHKDQESQSMAQIELDLHRTFPHHPYFNTEDSPGRQQMKRVLTAFSWRNPFVSYCQSINYVTGMLLLHYQEQEAFWMLVAILENLLPANFYNPTLTGLRVDGKVLDELIQERLPKLGHHFRECDVDTTSFVTGWFMRLFIDIFPLKTTLRLWDLMFSEGSKILFRAALSFLKLHERELLRLKHMGEILHYLNTAPQQQNNYTQLVKTGWSFYSLKRKTIDDLRTKWLRVVNQEIKDMDDRRQKMRELRQKQLEKEEELERQLMQVEEEENSSSTEIVEENNTDKEEPQSENIEVAA